MSLLTKNLLLGAVPALIAVGLALLLDYSITRHQFLEQIERNHNLEISLDQQRVRGALDSYVAQLRMMAETDEVKDADIPEILDYLARRQVEMRARIEGLYYNELDGTAHSFSGDQFHVGDRPYFSQVQRGELVITRLLQSRDTGASVLLILVPVFDSEAVLRGALGMTIREDQLTDLIASIEVGGGGELALVDSEDRLIAGNAGSELWTSEVLNGDHQAVIQHEGTQYIVNVREIPDTDWRIMIAYPYAATYGPLNRLTWTKLGGMGAGLAMALVMAGLASARTLGPLRNIMDVHRRYAAGDKQARVINRPGDELGSLADSFNEMADRLSKAEWQRERDLRDLELSERRFRQVFNSAGDGIFLREKSGKIVDVNQVACESLGYTREELLNLRIADVYNEWSDERGAEIWRELVELQNVDRMRIDGNQRRKDGTTFAVEIEASRVDQEGHPLILTVVRNVDQRKRAELEIKRAKEFAEKVINTSPGLTFIVDLQTDGIQFVNQQVQDVLGFTREEIQRGGLELVRQLIHPDDSEAFAHRLQQWETMQSDELLHVELRIRDASEVWRWFEIRETVFQRGEGQKVRQIIGTAVDVTDRIEAEQALRQSEQRYDIAIRYARQGVWSWDLQSHDVYWSDSLFQLLGLEPGSETPSRRRFLKRMHRTDRAPLKAAFLRFLVDRNPIELDVRVRHAEGRYRWFRISGNGEYGQEGELLRMAGTLSDVHAERIAQQALEDREAQYRAVFEAAANGFMVYTIDGKLVEANPAACQMRGYTREELLSLDPRQFVHPKSYHTFRDFLATVRRGERFDGQATGLRKDGSEFTAIIVGVPYQVGDQVMALASVVDITERQRAEAERESLIQSLEAINNELQQFTYTVSHDLKSPLITITGFMGILAEDLERGDAVAAKEDMSIIDDAAQKMKQLLDDLLELSRIGRVVDSYTKVDLAEVIDEVVMLLAGDIERRGVHLEVDITCRPIQGDRLRLRQVIQNLLDNAIKYGAEKQPRVRITARDVDRGIRVWIEDNGNGIPQRFHDKIFGLFEKLEPDSEGSGIGLAICKRIIDHHGGRIGIEPESEWGGSRFYIEIPQAAPGSSATLGEPPSRQVPTSS